MNVKRQFACLVAMELLILSLSPSQVNFWKQTNGPGAGNDVRSFVANSQGDLFAGTWTDGAVWKTTNNGASWTTCAAFPDPNPVLSLCRNSQDCIFASVYLRGVYRSCDGGTSWQNVSTGLTDLGVRGIMVDERGAVWVTTENGLFRSTNDGETWTEKAPGYHSQVFLDSAGAMVFQVGPHIYRSFNHGDTWDSTAGASGLELDGIHPDGSYIAGDGNSWIYRSTDYGANWTKTQSAVTWNGGTWHFTFDLRGDIFYAREGDAAGILVSRDAGQTWSILNSGLTSTRVIPLFHHPNGYVFAGTMAGAFRTFLNQDMPWNPAVNVTPASLSFSAVSVGRSDTMMLQVANIGERDTLRLEAVASSNAHFAATYQQTGIPPQDSRAVTVVYSPTRAEKDTGRISVITNDPNTLSVEIPVSGRGYTLSQAPVIDSIAPASGPVGSLITLSGSGFSLEPDSNVVRIGGVRAETVSGTASSLVVRVPSCAAFSPVTVTVRGLTGSSVEPFSLIPVTGMPLDTTSFEASVDFPTGGLMRMGTIADLDDDGKLDLIGTNNNNYLSIFRNTGSVGSISPASFAPALDVPTGTRPYYVSAGDLDGDGKVDLAVANNTDGTITVLRNRSVPGALAFDRIGAYPVGSATSAVEIADLDGDGRPDLVACNNGGGLTVWKNTVSDNTLTFDVPQFSPTPSGCGSLAIADFSGDGKPDVAVANGSNCVSVFRNTSLPGSISLDPPLNVLVTDNPWSVAAGDLDGDGKPDLVVGSNIRNLVSVLRNTSSENSISFTNRVDVSPGSLCWNAALGDLNGDGKLDLVVPNTSLGTVSVLVNTSVHGSFGFAPPVEFRTGGLSMSINIGDVDGDGCSDFVVGNYYSGNSISVLRRKIPTASATIELRLPSSTGRINFGKVISGSTASRSLTITNRGTRDTLHIDSVTTGSALFGCSIGSRSLPPGVSTTVLVTYSPQSAEGNYSLLRIVSNDASRPLVTVPLSGTGIVLGPAPVISSISDTIVGTGKLVRLVWYRSAHDAPGDSVGISYYDAWRKIAEPAPSSGSLSSSSTNGQDAGSCRTQDGTLWEFIETVPAVHFEKYAVEFTIALAPQGPGDSVGVYMVSARSPQGEVFFSEPDTDQAEVSNSPVSASAGKPVLTPHAYRLYPCYPNPFNPQTNITFEIAKDSQVLLSIYDSLGRFVSTLVEGYRRAGRYTVRWDAHAIASGWYVCRFKAAGFTATTKMLLLR